MKQTGLTLGGFIQPSIARNLLEQPANVEKGLCQRFLWFVAKPTSVPFDDLEKVNRDFSASVGTYINNTTYMYILHQFYVVGGVASFFAFAYNKINSLFHL